MQNQEKVFKKLDELLAKFKNAKEWTDLVKYIIEIQSLLNKQESIEDKTDSIRLFDYNDNETLAKRLAQCLNKDLPPGLHEATLNLYHLVLKNLILDNNQKLGKNLGLFSSGLFPFYQYASTQNKKLFLENIVQKIFLCINVNELELCLPGLLVSILPSLDENNEEINKTIFLLFDDMKMKLKPRILFGNIWSIMLKNPKLRSSGMKFLSKVINNDDYYKNDENNERQLKDKENFYPNFDILVVNSLCSVIEDKNDIGNIRLAMDFLLFRFPLFKKDIISDESKITLLVSVLKLLIKNESTIVRRVNEWILKDYSDEDINFEDENIIYILKLVTSAFKKIFDYKIEYNKDNQKDLKDYLKLIGNFIQNQKILSEEILKNISFNIIKCVVNYWDNELNSSKDVINDDIINNVSNLFNQENFLDLVWESLAKNLESFKINQNNNNELIYDLEKLVEPLKFCLSFVYLKRFDSKLKYYSHIISNLIKIVKEISINENKDINIIAPVIYIIYYLTNELQKKMEGKNNSIIQENNSNNNNNNNSNIINDFVNIDISKEKSSNLIKNNNIGNNNINIEEIDLTKIFYIEENMSYKTISANFLNNQNYSQILNQLSSSILEYQNYYINVLGKYYLSFDKNKGNLRNSIKIFKQSTEILIRLQEYTNQQNIPDWLTCLQKIIFNTDYNFSTETCNFLLDLLLTDSTNNSEIFKKIQSSLLNDTINKEIINENFLNKLKSYMKIEENFFEILFSYLWHLLKNEEFQKKSVDLMYKYFKKDKVKFTQLFQNSFNFKEPRKLEKAIQNFTQFWKYYIENYQKIIFFEKGECIFLLLNYLDSEYPLLRHLSKIWLNQSSNHFKKILDPIILLFLNKDIQFLQKDNHLYITKQYEIKNIINAFKLIKNVVLNVSDLNFIFNSPKNNILEQLNNNEKNSFNYLFLLFNISIRFLNAEFIEEIKNDELIEENISVASSSGEFLEILIKKLNLEEIKKITKNYLNEFFYILANKLGINDISFSSSKNVIKKEKEDKRNQVLQIQILEIIKLLMFNFNPNICSDLIEFIIAEPFPQCLVKGFVLEYYYVRRHYILFVENYLKMIMELYKKNKKNTDFENSINETSRILISETMKVIIDKVKYNEKIISFNNDSNQNFIIKNYLDAYKDYKTFDEDDLLSILNGLNSIVSYNLDLFHIQDDTKSDVIKKKMKEINSYNCLNFYNLFVNVGKNTVNYLNDMYESNIHDLISLCLICWINESENYEEFDYCLNNNSILAYKKKEKKFSNNINFNSYEKDWEKTTKGTMKKLVKKLFLKNPLIFFDYMIMIWNGDCTYDKDNNPIYPSITPAKDKLYKLTMLELLYSLNLDIDLILYCCTLLLKVRYNKPIKSRYEKGKNKIFIIPYEDALYESQMCHFIYSFILLEPRKKEKNGNKIIEIWKEFINFLNILYDNTKVMHTYCWMYELISLMLDIYPKGNLEINDIEDIVSNITEKLTNAAFKNQFDSTFQNKNFIILPIIPSLYSKIVEKLFPKNDYYKIINSTYKMNQNVYDDNLKMNFEAANIENESIKNDKNNNNNNNNYNNNHISNLYKETPQDLIFYQIYMKVCLLASSYEKNERKEKIFGEELQFYYRKIALLTLKLLFYKIHNSIVKDLYYPFKPMLKRILNCINDEDEFYSEISIQFLNNLMNDNSNKVYQVCGPNIFEILTKADFFKTSDIKLRNWRKIIAKYSQENKDIINNLIKYMEGGFFSKKDNKPIILKRISFVIYSCEVDTFSKNLNTIKDIIKDFFTEYNTYDIEKELFLMLRILFIRFSHENILEMIRQLWPIIFNELVKYLKQNPKIPIPNNIKMNKLEILKFIELLSLKNIEEFSFYLWIFIIDTFDIEKINFDNMNSLLQNILNEELMFHPFVIDNCEYWNDCKKYMISQKKGKSQLIINNNYGKGDKEALDDKIKQFVFSIIDMNNYKGEIDENNIEEIIEQDFLEKKTNKK